MNISLIWGVTPAITDGGPTEATYHPLGNASREAYEEWIELAMGESPTHKYGPCKRDYEVVVERELAIIFGDREVYTHLELAAYRAHCLRREAEAQARWAAHRAAEVGL